MFQAHIFFVNLWQLLMVLFQLIPKSGIFCGFSIIRLTTSFKVHYFHFSAKINNRKSCRQMRFSSSKYTKMRFRPGPAVNPTGELTALPRTPSSWWGRGSPPIPKTPPSFSALRTSSFRPLASKKLCIPDVFDLQGLPVCSADRDFITIMHYWWFYACKLMSTIYQLQSINLLIDWSQH